MKKLFLLSIFLLVSCETDQNIEQISYSQFKQEVLSDQIAKVVYESDQMTIRGNRKDGSKFETSHPISKKDDVVSIITPIINDFVAAAPT